VKSSCILDRSLSPRALVLSSFGWPNAIRLSLALAQAGFNTAVMLPKDRLHALHGSVTPFSFRRISSSGAVMRQALELWSPDLIVPCDEPAIKNLLENNRAAFPQRDVTSSAGGQAALALAGQKSKLIALAAADGLSVPATREITSAHDLHTALRSRPYPVVLKLDWTWGGNGVKVCADANEATRVYRQFAAARRPALVSRLFGVPDDQPELAAITLQQFIPGAAANRAIACHDGKVLAGVSVEVVQATGPTGPATVVRIIDHPEMAETAAHLARRLNLSGFHGFDFVLEEGTNRAVLLELNARATPICHFSFNAETDMCGALFARFAGKPVRALPNAAPPGLIAMFPQELWRDPASVYLNVAHHDVPWDEPEFVIDHLAPPQPRWVRAIAGLKKILSRGPRIVSIQSDADSVHDERSPVGSSINLAR